MTSLVDETTTSDFQDIGMKIISHLKTYSLFIFYQSSHLETSPSLMMLQKLTLKLRDDKNTHNDKSNENNKSINLSFCGLQNEIQLVNTLQDLKISSQEFKTRIVCYCSESSVINLYRKAKTLAINIESIPLCVYTSSIHSDFATFLGWGQPNIKSLSNLSILEIEKDVRKWVQSPTQKIDIWKVQIKVSEESGSIHKINQQANDEDLSKKKIHQQFFMSSLSVGYHPQLLVDYEQRRSSRQPNLLNKLIFSMQGIKKFCCVGDADMRQNTGIIKVDFSDQKGHRQMFKQFADYSQFQQLEQHKQIKPKDRRKILSILVSNITRFMGQKIKQSQGSRMNDNKLELLTFRSINDASRISVVSGQITMEFSPQHPVDLQVNDSYFRLEHPESLKITHYSKARVIINKQILSC